MGSDSDKTPSMSNDSEGTASNPNHSFTDWSGPDDADNPLNWPVKSKIYHSLMPGLVALVSTGAAPIYMPGRPSVIAEFDVGPTVALLPYCLYVCGLALGPVMAAPMSETFGRRPVYLIGVPISALFIMGAGFSNNIASLCICRFLAGAFSSPGLSNGSGTIADVWVPAQRAVPMALFAMGPFAGPSFAPLIGAVLVERFSWRWTQWFPIFLLAAIYVGIIFMKETYKKIILSQRAVKHGASPPPRIPMRVFVTATLIRPLEMLFGEPIVGLFSLYVAFNFALLYAFFAAFPFVFATSYNFSPVQQGLVFLAMVTGCVFGCATFIGVSIWTKGWIATRTKPLLAMYRKILHAGVMVPEDRLYSAMLGSIGLPVSLFWFAWTSQPWIHPMVCICSVALFAWSQILIFMASILYVSDVYGAVYSASALAAGIFSRQLLGAVFPLFTIQLFENLGTPWATSLLGFISVLLSLIPWGFYVWGPQLRNKTSYDSAVAKPMVFTPVESSADPEILKDEEAGGPVPGRPISSHSTP